MCLIAVGPVAYAEGEGETGITDSDFALVFSREDCMYYLYSSVAFVDYNGTYVAQGWNTDVLSEDGEFVFPDPAGFTGTQFWYIDEYNNFNTVVWSDPYGGGFQGGTYYSSVFINMSEEAIYSMSLATAIIDAADEVYPLGIFADGPDSFIGIHYVWYLARGYA